MNNEYPKLECGCVIHTGWFNQKGEQIIKRCQEHLKEYEKERRRKWYNDNKEKVAERSKKYHEENKEQIKEKRQIHREQNKEHILIQEKEKRKSTAYREYQKQYKQDHNEERK